jgi:Ras-related protein Rab-21
LQCRACLHNSNLVKYKLQAKNWVKELRKMLGPDICLTIVGNKIDLQKDQTVETKSAEE